MGIVLGCPLAIIIMQLIKVRKLSTLFLKYCEWSPPFGTRRESLSHLAEKHNITNVSTEIAHSHEGMYTLEHGPFFCFSFVDVASIRATRQASLRETYMFQCECSGCISPLDSSVEKCFEADANGKPIDSKVDEKVFHACEKDFTC